MMIQIRKRKNSQAGFTLVEIAIVLIIIGLLIGGIIQGQAMIQNARVKRLVSDFDGMRAAVLTFQDRFSQLPGDENNANTPTGDTNNGDADGLFDETDGWEIADLRLAGIIPGTGLTLPQNAFGGTLSVDNVDIDGNGADNYIVLTNIPAEVCQEIDTKYDDGVDDTGAIRAGAAYTADTTIALFGWTL
jgi:prepilin-type N-terminal cleavage/methylation domain-containing protein